MTFFIIFLIIVIFFLISKFYFYKESFIAVSAHSTPHTTYRSTSSNSSSNTSKSNSSSNNRPACFSKDSFLLLENGNTINITEAKIGDKILSYSNNNFIYSPIIAIPHIRNDILSKFFNIKTCSNKYISMTESHLIPIYIDNSFKLTQAQNIKINDTIITIDGFETITDINISYDNGIYTVVTSNDYIVVNNIVASPFAISHFLPSFYYLLHKIIFNIDPNILNSSTFTSFNYNSNLLFNKFFEIVL